MAYYSFISYLYIFLLIFHLSVESTSSTTNDMIINKSSQHFPLFRHRLHFISHICQRQKQYPLEILTRKFCLTRSQEEQRNKRVGWTISV